MKGKDLLTLAELSPSELEFIIGLAAAFKLRRTTRPIEPVLEGKTLALIFQKNSTRTRVSFEVAARELGCACISLDSNELQLGRGETIEDTAAVLSRMVHMVAARVVSHRDVVRLAGGASVPVVNALSDSYHPVQILADLLTLAEKEGRLKGLKVGWVGDGDNVCNSWLYGAALAGINLTVASPAGYEPKAADVKAATKLAALTGGSVRVTRDPVDAVSDADCVVTDSFVSMGFEKERSKRLKVFLPKYRVDGKLMSRAKKDAVFQHCMPVHRGEEVTGEVVDGPRSVVLDEAENRLHTTKALLCFLLLGAKRARALLKNP